MFPRAPGAWIERFLPIHGYLWSSRHSLCYLVFFSVSISPSFTPSFLRPLADSCSRRSRLSLTMGSPTRLGTVSCDVLFYSTQKLHAVLPNHCPAESGLSIFNRMWDIVLGFHKYPSVKSGSLISGLDGMLSIHALIPCHCVGGGRKKCGPGARFLGPHLSRGPVSFRAPSHHKMARN